MPNCTSSILQIPSLFNFFLGPRALTGHTFLKQHGMKHFCRWSMTKISLLVAQWHTQQRHSWEQREPSAQIWCTPTTSLASMLGRKNMTGAIRKAQQEDFPAARRSFLPHASWHLIPSYHVSPHRKKVSERRSQMGSSIEGSSLLGKSCNGFRIFCCALCLYLCMYWRHGTTRTRLSHLSILARTPFKQN